MSLVSSRRPARLSADVGTRRGPGNPAVGPGRPSRIRVDLRPDGTGGTAAVLTPLDRRALSAANVTTTLGRVPVGVSTVRTGVLTPDDAEPFLACGFQTAVQLEVLTHDLDGLPPRRTSPGPGAGVRFRAMRRTDVADLLTIDRAAFAAIDGIPTTAVARGWSDAATLDDAIRATPVTRVRVAVRADDPTRIIGFAVTGRARRFGYLQRLAVDPDHQSRGVGTALVLDSLRWCRRWGVRRVAVNTQTGNSRALSRYLALGFRRCQPALVICERRPVGADAGDGAAR